MSGFRRSRGTITIKMGEDERQVLRLLVGDLAKLVAPEDRPHEDPLARLVGIDSDAVTPQDPVLARLLPDGYGDDPEAAGEFRRFTERALREGKVADAVTVLDSLQSSSSRLSLTDEVAGSWLRTFNDVRLALGTRLEVTDDPQEMRQRLQVLSTVAARWDPGDDDTAPEVAEAVAELGAYGAYDWLTYLQESLVHALQS